MPEGLEAEIYRRAAAKTIGRVVQRVEIDERQEFAGEIAATVPGRTVTGVRRHGKLVILDLGPRPDGGGIAAAPPPIEPTPVETTPIDTTPIDTTPIETTAIELGLHFGMAGRLIVDDTAAIDSLAYSSDRDKSSWDRLVLLFTAQSGGGSLRVNDPRRWSRFTLEPNLTKLGPDLFEIDSDGLAASLRRRTIPVKSALLDQSVVAGLGNMLVDELLYQAGIDPRRSADSLDAREVSKLVELARSILPEMLAAGGSHSGDIDPDTRARPERCRHQDCANSDHQLERFDLRGRTTIACPAHQR